MAPPVTELRGRRVAVVGAGREGVSSAAWLIRQGARVTVCDRQDRRALGDTYRKLSRQGVTDWRLGPKYLDGLTGFDVVVRTPLRPYLSPEIQRAKRAGVTVTSQTKLFFERCPAPIIGVTGTKGKGTTASLLAAMLKTAGKRVHLGGNIGTPALGFLGRVKRGDIVVLELSSFQLQDLDRSPAVAVVTNVTADHLDYHATVREYRSAKRAITKYQRRTDIAVLNADDPGSRPFATDPGRVRWFSARKPQRGGGELRDGWITVRGKRVLRATELLLPGEHNLQNALAACLAAEAFGAGPRAMGKAIKAFRGLPYHMEYLGTKGGVRYFNDSYAAHPVAAIPAIVSVDTPLVFIAGGKHKKLDFGELARTLLRKEVRAVLLIPPEGRRIATAIRQAYQASGRPVPPLVPLARKSRIVPEARRHARPGDTVLFSPATSSMGWFTDFIDRGEYFSQHVRGLPR